MELLNHKYRLTIGTPINFYVGGAVDVSVPLAIPKAGVISPNNNLSSIEALVFEQHQVKFKIMRSKSSIGDLDIEVFNLGASTLAYLNNNQGKDLAIQLEVGYESEEEYYTIFTGSIVTFITKDLGVDNSTSIRAKDGYVNMREAYTTKTYPKGMALIDVIADVAKDLKVASSAIYLPELQNVYLTKPKVVNSYTKKVLDGFANDYKYKFYVQDNILYIRSNKPDQRQSASVIEINSATGTLLGSPTLKDNNVELKANTSGVRQSIMVKTPLIGSIKLSDKLSLISKYHNGLYEVESLEYNGDFEGSDWYIELELKPVDGWEKSAIIPYRL